MKTICVVISELVLSVESALYVGWYLAGYVQVLGGASCVYITLTHVWNGKARMMAHHCNLRTICSLACLPLFGGVEVPCIGAPAVPVPHSELQISSYISTVFNRLII